MIDDYPYLMLAKEMNESKILKLKIIRKIFLHFSDKMLYAIS